MNTATPKSCNDYVHFRLGRKLPTEREKARADSGADLPGNACLRPLSLRDLVKQTAGRALSVRSGLSTTAGAEWGMDFGQAVQRIAPSFPAC